MTVYFVTVSKAFNEQEEAETYAKDESQKTGRKYNVLARDEENLSMQNVATYVKGQKRIKPSTPDGS